MKKWVVLTTILVTVVLAFNACDKEDDKPKDPVINNPNDSINHLAMEGVFNPARKIHRIYSTQEGEQTIAQTWIWDHDTLKQIDNGNSYYSKFEYNDKHQIVKIIDYYNDNPVGYLAVTYKNNLFHKFERFENGVLTAQTEFTRGNNNKISQIKTTYYSEDYSSKNALTSLYSLFFGKTVSQLMGQSTHKSNTTETSQVTYQGNNIISISCVGNLLDMSYSNKIDYTYDNKKNPIYQNCYTDGVLLHSENNLTSEKAKVYIEEELYDEYTINYSYVYDNNWPVEISGSIYGISASTQYEYYE